MKKLVCGIRQQSGIGKESGKPYSIDPQLVVALDIEPVSRENLTIRANGFETGFLTCTAEVFEALRNAKREQFPMELDLDIDSVKRGDQFVSKCVGIRKAA